MHYGEFAIQTYYLALLIFCAAGLMFIVLFPLIKRQSKVFGTASLIIGVSILIAAATMLTVNGVRGGEGLIRLFRTFE